MIFRIAKIEMKNIFINIGEIFLQLTLKDRIFVEAVTKCSERISVALV